MTADDISLKNVECPVCDEVFDTTVGHLYGTCPNCNEPWWLDILWEPGWGNPVDVAKMRRYKNIRNHGPSWYCVEFGEP